MNHPEFKTHYWPNKEQLEPVQHGLHQHNLAHLGKETIENYHLFVINAYDESGEVIGGIHAELVWEWLYIRDLWVDARQRGQGIGAQLLAQAEAIAREKGFANSHLETTEYQARDFYLKCGYEIFGELPDKPKGHTWYYLKKNLS